MDAGLAGVPKGFGVGHYLISPADQALTGVHFEYATDLIDRPQHVISPEP